MCPPRRSNRLRPRKNDRCASTTLETLERGREQTQERPRSSPSLVSVPVRRPLLGSYGPLGVRGGTAVPLPLTDLGNPDRLRCHLRLRSWRRVSAPRAACEEAPLSSHQYRSADR